MRCITNEINNNVWDIIDDADGRIYRFGGTLFGAIHEMIRIKGLKYGH